MLSATLLILVVACLATFAYCVYTMTSDASADGLTLVKAHQVVLYVQLVMHLAQFAIAGLVVYKT